MFEMIPGALSFLSYQLIYLCSISFINYFLNKATSFSPITPKRLLSIAVKMMIITRADAIKLMTPSFFSTQSGSQNSYEASVSDLHA